MALINGSAGASAPTSPTDCPGLVEGQLVHLLALAVPTRGHCCMGKNAAKGKGGGRSKRLKTNESNGWLNVGDRTIITFRVDGVKFLYPAVVASVKIDVQIEEMTVKYADTSKPLLNADDAGYNMGGAFHGVHLMENLPEGRILDDVDNMTETTFTDKDEFKANSIGEAVLFASFFPGLATEPVELGVLAAEVAEAEGGWEGTDHPPKRNAVTRTQEPTAPGAVAAAAAHTCHLPQREVAPKLATVASGEEMIAREEMIALHAEGGHFDGQLGTGSHLQDLDALHACSVALAEGQDGSGKKLVNADGSLHSVEEKPTDRLEVAAQEAAAPAAAAAPAVDAATPAAAAVVGGGETNGVEQPVPERFPQEVGPFDYDIGPGGGQMQVCNFQFTDNMNLMGITFGKSKKKTIHIRRISTKGEAAELYQDRLQLGSLLVCINGQPIDGKWGTNHVQSACKDRPCTLTLACIPSEDIVWENDFCKGPKERKAWKMKDAGAITAFIAEDLGVGESIVRQWFRIERPEADQQPAKKRPVEESSSHLDAEQLDSVRSSLNSIIGHVVEAELERLRAQDAEQLDIVRSSLNSLRAASEQEEDLQTVQCCVCMATVPRVKARVEEEHATCLQTCCNIWVECCVCMDTVPRVKAMVCAGEEEHATCRETCFPAQVASLVQLGGDFYSSMNAEWGEKKAGDVMCSHFACVDTKCTSRPFTQVEVLRALDGRTIVETIDNVDHIVQVQPMYLAAHNKVVGEEAVRKNDEERACIAAAEEKRRAQMTVLQREADDGKRHVVEDILTLKCPRCAQAFTDFHGCFALICSRRNCKCTFCGWCLADCGVDPRHSASCHRHVANCKARLPGLPGLDPHFGIAGQFQEATHARNAVQLAAYFGSLAPDLCQRVLRACLEGIPAFGEDFPNFAAVVDFALPAFAAVVDAWREAQPTAVPEIINLTGVDEVDGAAPPPGWIPAPADDVDQRGMMRDDVDAAVGEAPAAELAAAVFQIVQVCACTPETATLALDATVDIESAVDLILTGFFNDLQVE